MSDQDAIVIGGGITGLCAAWALSRTGKRVTLIEADSVTGGVMRTITENGWQVEAGPNTLLVKPALYHLMQELDLIQHAQLADRRSAKRYVVVDGRMQALPTSPLSALTNPLIHKALPGILREPWAPPPTAPDEDVASFVTRRLGAPVLRNFIDPFVSGIHGGDPARLSVHAAFPRLAALEDEHGSILRGAFAKMRNRPVETPIPKEWRRVIVSFRDGLSALPARLTERLRATARIVTGTPINAITHNNDMWHVSSGENHWSAPQLIMATPAHVSAQLLRKTHGVLAETLEQIVYAPISSVSLGFEPDSVTHPMDGFGLLIPRPEKRRTLGALFSSTLFPGRTPADHRLLTAFIGGRLDPDAIDLNDAELISAVMHDLGDVLGLQRNPVWHKVIRWPRGIPQYEIGHLDRIAKINDHAARLNGLTLIGNWRGGISMVDCIANGLAVR